MVEGQAREEGGGRGAVGGGELFPRRERRSQFERLSGAKVRNDDHALEARDAARDLAHALETVDFFSRIAIAVGAEENPRSDLTEPIEHARHTEVGRA